MSLTQYGKLIINKKVSVDNFTLWHLITFYLFCVIAAASEM